MALSNRAIAQWAKDRGVEVGARTGSELAAAIAAGIHPSRITVYADALDGSVMSDAVNLGVGRVVVGSVEHIQLLRSVAVQRAQDVIVRMTDVNTRFVAGLRFDSGQADAAIAALVDNEWLDLVGLHCEVGSRDHDFVSFPAAIGHVIAAMTQVRRNHDKVLTRLSLGGARVVPPGRWSVELPNLCTEIEESLDDACATLRFLGRPSSSRPGWQSLDRLRHDRIPAHHENHCAC